MVSSTGGCRHRSGGFPYSCLTELPDCENKCTSLTTCIAYATNETHCALIPSNRLNCSAIDMSSHGSTVANLPYKKGTTNDLIHTSAFTGFNCSKIVIGEMRIYIAYYINITLFDVVISLFFHHEILSACVDDWDNCSKHYKQEYGCDDIDVKERCRKTCNICRGG